MDGILNLHKPAGPTSFDMVRSVRRASGEKRVGHAGTLDPAASGVLPLLLGQATRLSDFFLTARKTYVATVAFGTATDSHDAMGTVTAQHPVPPLTRLELEALLAPFRGEQLQMPPMFSALKQGGRPLYELARAGQEVERAARPVSIYRLDLLDWNGRVLRIEVECSRGTYIRVLAHELGQRAGCGAHLAALVRSRVGPFSVADAFPLIPAAPPSLAELQAALHPLDAMLLSLPAAILDEAEELRLMHGRALAGPALPGAEGGLGRAYGADGELLGLLTFQASTGWAPTKVLKQPAALDA